MSIFWMVSVERQYVAFEVAGTRFCVNIMDVQEVAREQQITHMPDFPDFVEGVINLRGVVVPIVSIHKKIGVVLQGKTGASSIKKYMIVKANGLVIGLMVDVLDRIITSDDSQIQDSEGTGYDPTLISGLIREESQLFLVLNTNGILDSDQAAALQQAVH
ncbi:MAG: chemotaxis protein CheW [Brevinema sp.]